MAWKILTFLAIFALSEARPPTSEQKVKIENWLSHIGSHEPKSHEVYASAYPSYEFTYEVSDPHTHDFKGQHEQRKGDEVKGYYWLIQPDGLKRTVKYHADKHSGFKAHVDYTKHWKEESNKEETEEGGEAVEEENNSGENENTEENESIVLNEGEGENENNENNESSVEEEENSQEEEETEESENREVEQRVSRGRKEQRNRDVNWKRGRNDVGRGRANEQRSRGSELKATVGIWQPSIWSQHSHNVRRVSIKQNENSEDTGRAGNENGEGSEGGVGEARGHGRGAENRGGKKGRGTGQQTETRKNEARKKSGKHVNEGKKEEHRQEKQTNEKHVNEEKKEEKQEQQKGNENSEGRGESDHNGKSIKTEYHVIIHHPKHHSKH